eukprot:659-Pelagococcus_subviridis.AAC.2
MRDSAQTNAVNSPPTEEVKMLTPVGFAMCALRPSSGDVPVTAYWDTMPRKDIIARRPFFTSFTFIAGESWPVGSNGKLPTTPDSPVAMKPRMRAASRKPMTTTWMATRVLRSQSPSAASPASQNLGRPTASVKRMPAVACIAQRPFMSSASWRYGSVSGFAPRRRGSKPGEEGARRGVCLCGGGVRQRARDAMRF